jgi:tetratricopeptide (TPR) repeat protein
MARSAARPTAPKQRISLLPAVIVLAITFIAFFPSLSNGFVNWDDNLNIYENRAIETLDAAHVKTIFSTTIIGNYNPLPILTFAIEKHFVGLNPRLFHIDNLILHLICVFLVFWLLRLLKLSTLPAMFGALLFGIHPMRVESVAWMTERKDVLYGTFYLGALVAYVRYLQTNYARKYYLIALALFAFALFAKIQAVALPLSFLALDYYFKRPLRFKLLVEKTPFFVMSVAVGGLGIYLLSKAESLKEHGGFTLVDRLLIGAYSLWVYLGKLFVPYPLSPVYPYPAKLTAAYYIAPVGVLALAGFLWQAHRRGYHALVFGSAFFFVNIMFLLQVLGAGQGFLADRFAYIPYIGFFFLGALLFERLLARKEWRTFAQAGAVIYLGVFAVATWKQCAIWKNGETLWTHVIKCSPGDPLGWGQRGFYYRTIAATSDGQAAQQLYKDALTDFNHAIEILDNATERFTTQKVTSHISRGKTYFDIGRSAEAIADFDKAIDLDPTYAEAYINRGAAYGKIGQFDRALADFNKGVELKPDNAFGYFNRSFLFNQLKKFDLALRDYDSYLALEPGNISILYERAVAKRTLGHPADAISDLNEVLRLAPGQPDVYLERSRTWQAIGKKDEALRDAKMARMNGAKVDDLYLKQLEQ